MIAVFDRPSLWQRIKPVLFSGFDGPLLAVVLAAGRAGLVTMYSVGYDHGTRFVDHGRNMLLAGVADVRRGAGAAAALMALAVPLYTLGVALLVATALFGITKKGATRWLNVGVVIQPSELLKLATPLMLAWWFQRARASCAGPTLPWPALLLLVPFLLVAKQPDLGTSHPGPVRRPVRALLRRAVLAADRAGGGAGGVGIVALIVVSERRDLPARRGLAAAARLPEAARVHPARPRQGSAGQGLPHHPGHDRHRLGRRHRQGLHEGHADAPGVHPRAHHRLHLRRLRRGVRPAVLIGTLDAAGGVLLLGFTFLILRGLMIAAEAPTMLCSRGCWPAWSITLSLLHLRCSSTWAWSAASCPWWALPLPFVSYGGTAMVTLGLGLGHPDVDRALEPRWR
jgi:rod shape determining protein RodA